MMILCFHGRFYDFCLKIVDINFHFFRPAVQNQAYSIDIELVAEMKKFKHD